MGSGKIMRREPDGKITVLADKYEGRHLNAPNDLAIKSDGAVYFTDIRKGSVTKDENPPEGVPHTGVYMLKAGKLTLLDETLDTPNGIAFSPDEKTLYVNDIRPKKVYAYDVRPDGTTANRRVFIDMTSDNRPGAPDGMRIDVRGNVWDSGPGGIWIVFTRRQTSRHDFDAGTAFQSRLGRCRCDGAVHDRWHDGDPYPGEGRRNSTVIAIDRTPETTQIRIPWAGGARTRRHRISTSRRKQTPATHHHRRPRQPGC